MLGRLLEEAALGAEAGVGEDGVDPAEGSSAAAAMASTWSHSVDVAAHRERPLVAAELARQAPRSAVLAAGAEHQPVAGLGRPPAVAAPMPLHAPVISRTASPLGHRLAHARRPPPAAPVLPTDAAIIAALPMDPARKRKIRLVVALGAAVLLAVALVYTSFSASTEAKQPSELLNAAPGASYELTGVVVQGSIQRQRPAASASGSPTATAPRSDPGHLQRAVPDPFRGGREMILTGKVENGTFVGRPRHPDHQVPVEVRRPRPSRTPSTW